MYCHFKVPGADLVDVLAAATSEGRGIIRGFGCGDA